MKFIKKHGQLLKEEEKFTIFMDPLIYANLNDVNEELVFYIFQNELHFLLNSFFNPLELSNISKILYPLISNLQQTVTNRVYLLYKFINKYNMLLSLSPTFIARVRNYITPKCIKKSISLAKVLSLLYKHLMMYVESYQLKKSSITLTLDLINKKLYTDNNFLKPIYLMQEYLKKRKAIYYFKHFILHGSLATLDYIEGWSDVDTFAIINDDVVIDYKKLLRTRSLVFNIFKYFTIIDPYQHHGVFVVTETDTKFYPQAYLPFETLKYSKVIIGDNELLFTERKETLECLVYFWKAVQIIRNAYMTRFPFKNYYFMKLFLSYLNTLPTYYLQAKGIHVYKKYSFEIVEREKLKGWESVKIATYLRKNYTRKNILPTNISVRINEFTINPLWNTLINYLIKNKNKLNKKHFINKILSSSILLTEAMCKNVLEKNN